MRKYMKKASGDKIFDIVAYAIITLLILACLYPVWYVFCASLSDPAVIARSKGILLWPSKINFEAYRRVFANKDIWNGLVNTVFYTVVGTGLNVILTSMLAYALSRKQVLLKKPLTMFVSFTMFFNGGMIPTYLVVRDIGLLDHRFAVILPGLVSVFNFIIMRTNFESIPMALEESAKLDGANHWVIFSKIFLPNSRTSLAVMVLFYGVTHWNGWMQAMLYLPNRRDLQPLALITREIVLSSASAAMSEGAALTQEMADAIKYATIVVSILPILCIYPFLQRYYAQGIMTGAVKG